MNVQRPSDLSNVPNQTIILSSDEIALITCVPRYGCVPEYLYLAVKMLSLSHAFPVMVTVITITRSSNYSKFY